MQNAYPEITPSTAQNRARSYLKYFKENGFVNVETVGKNTKVYNFLKAPFEAEKPAQSDFNPDVLKTQMALELDTMRRA